MYTSIYDTNVYEYPTINGYREDKSTIQNGKGGRVLGWISGGVASAIACKRAIEEYGDRVELFFCDTQAEHSDTYRFIHDYETTLGVTVKTLKSPFFNSIEEVWEKYVGLNFAHGAPCSMVLKREVRSKEQNIRTDFGHIFGFDYKKSEIKRAEGMLRNHPEINPIFPLIVNKITREDIFAELDFMGIKPPISYNHFLNNNCIGDFDSPRGGCVQGGIGYWQKIQELFPAKFDTMAEMEHHLSDIKGSPVTICKDQRGGIRKRLFLKPHPNFPNIEDISAIKGRRPITPFECNGFCSDN